MLSLGLGGGPAVLDKAVSAGFVATAVSCPGEAGCEFPVKTQERQQMRFRSATGVWAMMSARACCSNNNFFKVMEYSFNNACAAKLGWRSRQAGA